MEGGEDPEESFDAEVEATFDTSVSLESDLHTDLAVRIGEIEEGLALVPNGVEYQTEAGKIDLLARDGRGALVVIELKAGKANDGAIGQLLGYLEAVMHP